MSNSCSPRTAMAESATVELVVARVGAQGDGIAETPAGAVWIPFTAPGDRVEARLGAIRGDGRAARLERLLAAGPARTEPPCPHFGRCGGCALQHLSDPFVADWKRERIVAALGQRGFAAAPVEATRTAPAATRRRAGLGAVRVAAGVLLGFSERGGHRLVDVASCAVLHPALARLLPELRPFLTEVLRPTERADVQLETTDAGVSLWIVPPRPAGLAEREAGARFAERLDLARLAWGAPPEPLAVRRPPTVRLGDADVELPPGAFRQPSAEGEAILTELVQEGIGEAARVVDLFGGLGTFALPLARRRRRVELYEGDRVLVAALTAAVRRAGLASLHAAQRDLFRRPLLPAELERYDAAVLDPPRAGAEAQARMLAASGLGRVVMVSCNPATFARDARILAEGGYRLARVVPVDQFRWSPHTELVAHFERPGG